jgi:hypothetical protein
LVEKIARNPAYFDFLARCGNNARVVIGDARLNLAASPDGAYDVLILDAFSSDSIPMHLLTREAVTLYLQKLAPGGYMLFHISSRNLDLAPVIASLAADAGLSGRLLFQSDGELWHRFPSVVAVLARSGTGVSRFDPPGKWMELPPAKVENLWTDQRSDLLSVINLFH